MQPAAILAVVVKAQGVTGTNAQLGSVQRTAEKVDSKVTRMGNSMVTTGKKMQSAGKTMTVGLTLPLVGAGYLAVKTAATFERSMAQVKVAGEVGGKGMKELEKLALKMGAETVFSANDASEAMLELVKSGITPAQVKAGALGSTMNLAATESMELGRTAEIVGAAMNTFNLKAGESGRIADALAGGAIASAASVEGLAASLSQGGQSAAMYGLSVEETVGALAAFAQNGIQASDAGTSFKTFMMRLNPVQKKQKELMNELNLSFFNQSGHLVNLVGVSKRLREALSGMTQQQRNAALQTLFGSDAQRAANIVFQEGPKGLAKYIKATEARGAAEKMANAQMKGMPGAIERMKGSLETAALVAGSAMAPAITAAANVIEDLANGFSMLPPDMQTFVIVSLAVVAALGPMVYIMGAIIKNGGYVVKAIGWVVAALSTQTAATTTAAVANAELAASYHAATVAQTEFLIANRSGAVVGSVPMTTPVGAPVIAPAAGASTAATFAKSMAKSLGPALALVGIGTIVISAVQGDMKAAGFKLGGAIAGGIAGFLIGGPLGAMIGVGLGAVIGGALGGLFDAGKQLHPLQEKLAAQSKRSAQSWRDQKQALQGLRNAEEQVSRAKGKHKEVTGRATSANRHLNRVIEKYGPVSRQAHRAELTLARARRENTAAANAEKNAEKMSDNQRKLALLRSRQVVAVEKARIPNLQAMVKQLTARSNKDKNNIQVLQRLVKAENQLAGSQKKIRGAIKDVASIAPKQAQALRRMNSVQAEFGMKLKGLLPIYRAYKVQSVDSTRKASQGWVDFRGKVGTSTSVAKKDIFSFTEATTKGVDITRKDLYKFANQLGIKNVSFGVGKAGGKNQKKQKGGMVVPGAGTGDKVPLTALVEPGEVVHVLNMRAAKDRQKLGGLEMLNQAVPRFQGGGTFIDPAGPGVGIVNKAIAGIVGQWSTRYNAAINYGYDPGGGHVSPGHNVTGTATDTGPAAGWEQGTKLFEQGLRAIEGQVDQILYGSHGIGEAYPNHGWGNHAHIEWGMHPAVQGVLGALVKQLRMTGPDGQLKDLGQATLDHAVQMANRKLKELGGVGGGPDLNLQGIEGSVASQAAQIAQATGSPHRSTLALFEALWAESGMGAAAPGNVLQGLGPGGAPIMSAAREISGFLTGKPRWTGTAAIPLARSTDWPAHTIAQAVQKSAFSSGSNYLAQKANALETMSQFGLQEGGLLKLKAGGATKGKGKEPSIQKGVKDVLGGLSAGKHLPKYRAALKRLGRRITGIGISPQRVDALGATSKDVEKFAEYASNASSLTTSIDNPVTKEEEVIQGLFKGRPEGAWLNEQLNSLLKLRREVIGVHGTIETKQLPRVNNLMKDAKSRLKHVRRAIREAEEKKRELEKKIKEIEAAQKKSKDAVEKEIKELEQKLDKAGKAKKPNHAYMDQLRGEIRSRKDTISQSDSKSTEEIKGLKKQITKITDQNKGRARVESALTGTIIPSLETQKSGMHESLKGLFSSGGEIKGTAFSGLQTVQGLGGPLDTIPEPPPIGMLGGEVFTVQNRLKEIQEEAARVPTSEKDESIAEELLAIERELNMALKKENIALKYQTGVFNAFPSVGQVAVPKAVQYAGAFAKGGVMGEHMMAWVGEKGPEPIFGPRGSRVIPTHDAMSALKQNGSGPSTLVIEQLVINEDGTVTVKTADDEFDAEVRNITRKQSRPAVRPTPGGTKSARRP